MPTRPVGALIIVFWLATTAWYIRREIAPYWNSHQAPAFAIDIADEAIRQSLPVSWTLIRRGHSPSQVRTSVLYHEGEDEFSLNCQLWKLPLTRDLKIDLLHSSYRVARDGRLIATTTRITFGADRNTVTMLMSARIRDHGVDASCQIHSPWGNLAPTSEWVAGESAAGLNPLHPVHKLRNVRIGQRWVQPLSDPLAQAQQFALVAFARSATGIDIKDLVHRAPPRSLIAEVVGPEPLEWHGEIHSCLVIEYHGDNHSARTWVRAGDGWVLRQEVAAGDDQWVLQRD